MSFLNHTKIFTVHTRGGLGRALEQPVFIREGFNFYAFFFTFFWALYHRLWKVAAGIFVFNLLILSLQKQHMLSEPNTMLMLFAMQLVVGFHANDWRRERLARQGYIVSDITVSESLLKGQQRYFERLVGHH